MITVADLPRKPHQTLDEGDTFMWEGSVWLIFKREAGSTRCQAVRLADRPDVLTFDLSPDGDPLIPVNVELAVTTRVI
jgi:hypothetical protein